VLCQEGGATAVGPLTGSQLAHTCPAAARPHPPVCVCCCLMPAQLLEHRPELVVGGGVVRLQADHLSVRLGCPPWPLCCLAHACQSHVGLHIVWLLLRCPLVRISCLQPLLCRLVRCAEAAPEARAAGGALNCSAQQLQRLIVLRQWGAVCSVVRCGGGSVSINCTTHAAAAATAPGHTTNPTRVIPCHCTSNAPSWCMQWALSGCERRRARYLAAAAG
jgi:hypothetical protein